VYGEMALAGITCVGEFHYLHHDLGGVTYEEPNAIKPADVPRFLAEIRTRFPDHYDDVAAAVAWLRRHIAARRGDPSRIALLGHSAGADIVSNVAVNPRYLAARGQPLTALRCFAPLDTAGFDKARASAQEQRQWRIALGNEPTYLTSTSATLLVRPGIGIPPALTVFRGTPGRIAIEQGFAAALRRVGVPATLVDARTLTHNQVNQRIGAPGKKSTSLVSSGLAVCKTPAGTSAMWFWFINATLSGRSTRMPSRMPPCSSISRKRR